MREACQGDGVGDHRKVGPDHSKDASEFFWACDARGSGSNGEGVQPGVGRRQKSDERQPRLAIDTNRTRPEPTGRVSLSKRN